MKNETNGKTRRYGKRGNPFKRGNTWTILYYPIDPKTGKKKQRWKGGFKTKKEAQELLYEINLKLTPHLYRTDKDDWRNTLLNGTAHIAGQG